MLKVVVALAAVVAASPSWACGTWTMDNREPGETLATIEDDRILTIDDRYGGKEVYDLVSAGTGIPFMVGQKRGGGEDVQVMEHAGDLVIDMMIYVPFCGKGGRP